MKLFTTKLLKTLPVLVVGMGSYLSANAEIITGPAGTNVTFELNTDTKVLTLSGTGATANGGGLWGVFSAKEFKEYNDVIETIIIKGGITKIGDRLFQGVDKVKDVYMPCSLSSLGQYIFDNGAFSVYHNYTLHCPEGSWIAKNYNNTVPLIGTHTATSLNIGVRVQTGVFSYVVQGSIATDWNTEDAHNCVWEITKPAGCLQEGTQSKVCKNVIGSYKCNKIFVENAPLPSHVTALTHVDPLEFSTCVNPMNVEHFACAECGNTYLDDKAVTPLAVKSSNGVIVTQTHALQAVDAAYDDTEGKYAPYHSDAWSSNEYIIYTPEQVGVVGDITKIAFRVIKTSDNSKYTNSTVKIGLATTTTTSFPDKATPSLSNNSFTEVYTGKMKLAQTLGWEEFVLTKAFNYDGKKNLVIRVSHDSGDRNIAFNGSYGYQHMSYNCYTSISRAVGSTGSRADARPENGRQYLPDLKVTAATTVSHQFAHHDGVEMSCFKDGQCAYEECEKCGHYFHSEVASVQTDLGIILDKIVTIEAPQKHSYVNYNDAAAVRDEDGLYHTECSVCHDGHDGQRYAKVVISSKGYTTVFYAVPLHSEGDAAESFAVSEVKDDAFMLTPVENLGAGEGFVIKGTPNAVYWFPEQEAEGDANSILGGSTENILCESKEVYVLGVGANSQKIGFYPYAGTRLSAYKAYYKPADDNGAEGGGAAQMAGFRMEVKGSADAETAIEELNAEAAEVVVYDLSGRKVSSPKKGQPYIKAGKKIIF